jgi:hypothetical protein
VADTPGEKAVSPKPNTQTDIALSRSNGNGATAPEGRSITLTPADLKRLGLTPGSLVWRALLEEGVPPADDRSS